MLKFIILIVISISLCSTVEAQSFFKPLPKSGAFHKMGISDGAVMNAVRPVANIASYGVPGNILLSGGGISYQHLKFDATTQKWDALWSVNALTWLTTSATDPRDPNLISYGVSLGFFNNIVLTGIAFNGNKVFGTIGIGISLNN